MWSQAKRFAKPDVNREICDLQEKETDVMVRMRFRDAEERGSPRNYECFC